MLAEKNYMLLNVLPFFELGENCSGSIVGETKSFYRGKKKAVYEFDYAKVGV